MSPQLLTIASLLFAIQLFAPKKWAFIPILIAACHTSNVPVFSDFTPIRIVIFAGLLRASFSHSLSFSLRNHYDRTIALFCFFIVLSSFGHDPQWGNPYMFRLGFVLNIFGTYLYFKSFVKTIDDWKNLQVALVYILIPLALMMLYEFITRTNPYRLLGARQAIAWIREGQVRAQGPFGGPILAGTAGAVSLPLLVPLYKRRKRLAIYGIAASLSIVVFSSSSGPIGTVIIGLGSLYLWKHRTKLRSIVYSTIALLFVLDLIKERPIWYLIALIDFVGGSTGWHRSALIDAGINHFGEWWFMGTDMTRHWMPYGLPSIPNHTDLTNYFLHIGVIAGVVPVILLSAAIFKSLKFLARQSIVSDDAETKFILWSIWCAIFSQTITFLTISYYDQMFVFFYVLIAFTSNLFLSQPVPNSVSQLEESAPIPNAT